MIEVRTAADGDDDLLRALEELARHETVAQRGGACLLDELDERRTHETILERYVALVDGAVVGYGALERSGDRALISSLFVHPSVRGVGVGHALLAHISADAKANGALHLDSYALPGDRETKNFFESHAMKSRLLVVHQEL